MVLRSLVFQRRRFARNDSGQQLHEEECYLMLPMDDKGDLNRALMLDGNAVAGLLHDVFGIELTASPTKCAHCGAVGRSGRSWLLRMPPVSCCVARPVSRSSCASSKRPTRSIWRRAALRISVWSGIRRNRVV